jgi:hypothetical protein
VHHTIRISAVRKWKEEKNNCSFLLLLGNGKQQRHRHSGACLKLKLKLPFSSAQFWASIISQPGSLVC